MKQRYESIYSFGWWYVFDTLHNQLVPGSKKISVKLANAAADVLNQQYNEAMERNRKQIFNETYSVRR